jgi:hypothetical protein
MEIIDNREEAMFFKKREMVLQVRKAEDKPETKEDDVIFEIKRERLKELAPNFMIAAAFLGLAFVAAQSRRNSQDIRELQDMHIMDG